MSDGPLHILNTEPGRFSAQAREALRRLGRVEEVEADRAYLLGRAGDFDALFVCLRNVIDQPIIERATRLRCIVTPTTGTDHIDVAAARLRSVDILSLAGEVDFLRTITATAELTWGLLLALLRQLPAAHQSVMAGRWARDEFKGTELRGKTLGVIGYGRLGRMVAEYGRAFHMKVLAFDRVPEEGIPGVEFLRLDELLERADVVSLHLPLAADTAGFFGASAFQRMKHGAVLINTSRGRIVDEPALLQALQTGRLAGAALDVLADESSNRTDWLATNQLRAFARDSTRLLITPHVGGVTQESVDRTNLFMIDKLERYLRAREG